MLTSEEKEVLGRIARDAVRASLEGRGFREALPEGGRYDEPGSCFVTLTLAGRLRGCIGLIGERFPLARCVREAATRSLADPRFPPLTANDLEDLDVEVSVLTPLEPLEDVGALEPGRHGIHVALGHRGALFLPKVATEQGWDRERLLAEVCRKAGLAPRAWEDPEAVLSTFEAEVF